MNRLWPGFACSVQGFFINVGDVASSIWSFVIALHTFLLLAGGQRSRAWASEKSTMGKGRWIFCLGVWAAICFLGLIGPLVIEPATGKGPFCTSPISTLLTSDNGAGAGWCWIGHKYPYERIFFHYCTTFGYVVNHSLRVPGYDCTDSPVLFGVYIYPSSNQEISVCWNDIHSSNPAVFGA